MKMTLISDRDKSLLVAVQMGVAVVNHLICCFHLKCNFVKRYGGVQEHIWRIAKGKSQAEYNESMEEHQKMHRAAADYLVGVAVSQWVICYAYSRFFGQKTLTGVKSMNSTLRAQRELAVLNLLTEILHLTIAERFKLFERA